MPDFGIICTDRKLYGTSISIFQHPTSDNNGEVQENSPVNSKAKNLSEPRDTFSNTKLNFVIDGTTNPIDILLSSFSSS